ncbi:hypothetical protein CY35_06G095400 [Sphagnum magellanicum]|nr:hypothetical protein CY35_06G095400 [Sphagnum magellanicum]
MFKLQAVPTGFQMYLPSMATLATCTTSSADAYKVKAKPGYKFYMTATPFSMVPYDATPGDWSSWAKKVIANLPP